MYRFVWQPRWIVSHLLILALVVTMVNLGFWQLRRLDSRQQLNATITSRAEGQPDPFDEVVAGIDTVAEGKQVDYRHVRVRGTYDTSREITVPGQSSGGAPGRWVATPLRTDSGRTVLVLRGHLAAVADDVTPPIAQAEPPTGEVEIVGWVRRSQERTGLEPTDAAMEPHRYSRLDLPRIAAREQLDLEPVLVQLGQQAPATDQPLLRPIPLPELTEGSHFSYAIQWWIFSLIAVIGYPLVLRRTARMRAAAAEGGDGATGGDGSDPDGGTDPIEGTDPVERTDTDRASAVGADAP